MLIRVVLTLSLVLTSIATAAPVPTAEMESEWQNPQEEQAYRQGQQALDSQNWETAAESFRQVYQMSGRRADGGLYWHAYAQFKGGRPDEALENLSQLNVEFPESNWKNEAEALEFEIRQSLGQTPEPAKDENLELQILALNALMNVEPEKAFPRLRRVLEGSNDELKEKALFVLMQHQTPDAIDLAGSIARGDSNPRIQGKAIQYLGLFGGEEGQQVLGDIYESVSAPEIRKSILRSFMISGNRTELLAAAEKEENEELRIEAIRQLGIMGANDDLWTLYKRETSREAKRAIVQSFFVGGQSDHLMEVFRTEEDAELRKLAVRNLGLIDREKTGQILADIYRDENDLEVKSAAIMGLFLQGNDVVLVELARAENDAELKKAIVKRLSLMNTQVSIDYLMESLNQ